METLQEAVQVRHGLLLHELGNVIEDLEEEFVPG